MAIWAQLPNLVSIDIPAIQYYMMIAISLQPIIIPSRSRVDHTRWIEAEASSHPHPHASWHRRGNPGPRALSQAASLLPLPLLRHCHPPDTDETGHWNTRTCTQSGERDDSYIFMYVHLSKLTCPIYYSSFDTIVVYITIAVPSPLLVHEISLLYK
jgi:hypothetical protein